MRTEKIFTLIELLVVIAIIAIPRQYVAASFGKSQGKGETGGMHE